MSRTGRAANSRGASAPVVVGVDIGGTNVRVAVATPAGDVLSELSESTHPDGGELVVVQVARMIRTVVERIQRRGSDVVSVAVGVPGFVPAGAGSAAGVVYAANIAGFDEYPLRSALIMALESGLGEATEANDATPNDPSPNDSTPTSSTPGGFASVGPITAEVTVDNDVNVAALGELDAGGFGTAASLVVISVGTGVGAGVVVGGHIVRGAHGAAGEVAFLPIGADSSKHRRAGALEAVASGPAMQLAIADAVRSAAEAGVSTVLRDSSSPADALNAASTGDVVAQEIVARQCRYLADAILAVCAVVDPDVVVLTGGLGSNPLLLEPLRAAVAFVMPYEVRLVTSRLGDRSGLVGAVALASQRAEFR
jgi:glucokinase